MFEDLFSARVLGEARGLNADVQNILSIGAGNVHEDLPFLLPRLKGKGIPWFSGKFGMARNYRGVWIGNGRWPIREILGIREWREEKKPHFQWLVVTTSHGREVQFLFQGGRFEGAFDVARTGRIPFLSVNPDLLLTELRNRKRLLREFDFGLVQQRPKDWKELKSILEDAYTWSGLVEKREIWVGGQPDRFMCSGAGDSGQGRTFFHLARLGVARYRPDCLSGAPLPWETWPNPESLPILIFRPGQWTARERLGAEVRLREWVRKGGYSLEDIEARKGLDEKTVTRFVATHKGEVGVSRHIASKPDPDTARGAAIQGQKGRINRASLL